MEEEEAGQIVPEDAGTGVNFNAIMQRMARESIAGVGPSISIDVEVLRATAATLAQKAMAMKRPYGWRRKLYCYFICQKTIQLCSRK